MKLSELFGSNLYEMAYRQKKAETIITGLEKPINYHLLKVMAVAADRGTLEHWRRELRQWAHEIAMIRLKPNNKTAAKAFYYRILYDEPFGGVEERNVMGMLAIIRDQGHALRDDVTVAELLVRLKAFHEAFATRCHNGDSDFADIIP